MKKVIFTYDSKDMKHGQNGEIGEASASILVEDERAKEIHANGVYICEACGTDEALRDWTGNVKPLSDWVLVRVYNGDLRR